MDVYLKLYVRNIDLSKQDEWLEKFQNKGKVIAFVYLIEVEVLRVAIDLLVAAMFWIIFQLFLCIADTKVKHHFKGERGAVGKTDCLKKLCRILPQFFSFHESIFTMRTSVCIVLSMLWDCRSKTGNYSADDIRSSETSESLAIHCPGNLSCPVPCCLVISAVCQAEVTK